MKRFVQFFLAFFLASLIGGFIAFELLKAELPNPEPNVQIIRENNTQSNTQWDSIPRTIKIPEGLDFIYAAERVTPTVVHIRTYQDRDYSGNSSIRQFLDRWMGSPENNYRPPASSGSGVIISGDGYIVTNFHVVEESEEIVVILDDKREFAAEIIGTDPTTDLALIKIQEDNLPSVSYGNSDEVRVGEWVLAVGNPFDLTSTVTAGIVSAKGRNINILRNQLAIESFIQTDAAVNPGNSGGALVNLKGELIGVNTAIATRTGSFSGYSFAVPVSLVEKVTQDLLEYGEVQRALLGVIIREVDASLAQSLGIEEIEGVFIEEVNENSAANDAGLERGDIIISINGNKVNSPAELQEQVAKYRPGREVNVKYRRGNEYIEIDVVLKNTSGNTALLRREVKEIIDFDELGISVQELDKSEMDTYALAFGLKVLRIGEGLVSDQCNMDPGFIILEVNGESMENPESLNTILNTRVGRLIVEGQYPDGRQKRFQLRR